MKNIVILGGGISGLSAAWYARKKYQHANILLLEKTNRLGGWIQTSLEGGFLFEQGPRTFVRGRSSHLLSLIEEMGLKEDVIDSAPSRRFLWTGGRLRSMASFIPMLILPLLREPFIPKGSGADESIYDFASRRLGPKIANTLIDALALGIYAGDIHKLSIRSCFPFLYNWEQQKGSLLLGALLSKKQNGNLFTLRRGMGTLIQTLAERSKADISLDSPVEEIRSDGVIAKGKFYPADLTISALSGGSIGRLTGLWTDFEEKNLGLVHLAYQGNVLSKKGFGYLVPTQEGENLLGMIWDSAVFPQQSVSLETRVTAMMRRASIDAAQDAMKRHLSVSAEPLFASVHLAKAALPQFPVGYGARLARFEAQAKEKYPALFLLGNYLRGASVDACIALAQNLQAPHS